jgi:hypothetical protein
MSNGLSEAWKKIWTDKGWFGPKVAGPPSQQAQKKATGSAREGVSEPEHAQVTLSLGGATAAVDLPCCKEDKPSPPAGKKEPDGIAATVLKVAGAAAAGITATGFIIAVGAALFWIRFDEAGMPATQVVGLLSQNELLVQGAEVTIVFLAVALAIVLLLYFADPEGRVTRVPLILLGVLTLLAIVYLVTTDLPFLAVLPLAFFTILLLGGCVLVGLRTGARFWPLALAVFVATLTFAAVTGIFIVKEQEYVQAVAVLRGADDSGVTGIYATATDELIYIGRLEGASTESGAAGRGTLFDVPREGTTFAVGPLESVSEAKARGPALLTQLIEDQERSPQATPPAPKPPEPAPQQDGKKEGAATPPQSPGAGAQASEQHLEDVAEAFETELAVRHAVRRPWGCLVRYASAGSPLTGHWWTSCAETRSRDEMTLLEIRDHLALPGRFQSAYDMKVVGHLRRGADLLYLEGPIAPQCEHRPPTGCGHEYPGGGRQIYLPDPTKVERLRASCSATPPDEVPDWGTCSASPAR